MATEKTPLIKGHVIKMPLNEDDIEFNRKLKSLSYEELSPFLDDPWWKNVRKTFFLSFWIFLIMLFLAACILSIYQQNSCPSVNKNPKNYLTIPITYSASVNSTL